MIAGLEPGKVVTVDRELQQRVTTLMLMLYGATAKYGIGSSGAENGVLVTAQVPVLQVPANHQLQWEVSEDGKTVMLYIVLNEESGDDRAKAETPSMGDTAVGEAVAEVAEETPPPAPIPGHDNEGEPIEVPLIGDEFEDEIKVGLTDGD